MRACVKEAKVWKVFYFVRLAFLFSLLMYRTTTTNTVQIQEHDSLICWKVLEDDGARSLSWRYTRARALTEIDSRCW